MSAINGNAGVRHIWMFSDCALDEQALQLSVRGRPVELERKPAQLLLYLLRHAGERVSKDALFAALWPGRFVGETNLTKAMAVLRAAIGQPAAGTIRTLHGYGYALVGPVQLHVDAPDKDVEELLAIIAGQIDQRYADNPQRASELHRLLGAICLGMGFRAAAQRSLSRAAAVVQRVASVSGQDAPSVSLTGDARAREFATG